MRGSDTCEEQWDSFSTKILHYLDKHAPLRRFKIHNPSPPAVTEATLELMSRRRAAKAIGDMQNYQMYNKRAKRAIRKDMRDNIKQKVSESSPAMLFHQLKPVIAPKRGNRIDPINLSPDEVNEYFASIGSQTRERVMTQFQNSGMESLKVRLPRVNAGALTLTPVTLEELKSVLNAMPSEQKILHSRRYPD